MRRRGSLRSALRAAFIAAGSLALLPLASCAPGSTHGADDYFEGRALQLAAASERGESDTITRLIKSGEVDPDRIFAKGHGFPLLAWPLRARSLDGLKSMLIAGADPNARAYKQVDGRNLGYNNALVYAAKMEDPRYLELLLKHGGDPNTRNSADETLLYQAFVSGNKWSNVKLLIQSGAHINETNRGTADTVLSWYTGRGGFEHAYWLLEHGADPTILMIPPKESGKPSRMIMAEDIYWEITTPDLLPWQKKCQQWLIARGIPRPPMPEHIRKKREAFGFPTEEKDVPLL